MKRAVWIIVLTILICLCGVPFTGNTQEQGIRFEQGLSWQQILAKASAENKPIFMDCYTTWCGPCKVMDERIFPVKEVGDYYNAHFINVRVQMDKTAEDPVGVQNWYQDAANINKDCNIHGYPTFLFYSPEGKAIHQFTGLASSGNDFINKARAVIAPDKQYFTLLANLKDHLTDSPYLHNAIIACIQADDKENARKIAKDYINCLKVPVTGSTIGLLSQLIAFKTDAPFQFYLQNVTAINRLEKSKNFVERKLAEMIFREDVTPELKNKNQRFNWEKMLPVIIGDYQQLDREQLEKSLNAWFQNYISHEIRDKVNTREMQENDWKIIARNLKKRYTDYDCDLVILLEELRYYSAKKNVGEKMADVALILIDRYGKQIGDQSINDLCWKYIFLCSDNKKTLQKAIRYEKLVIKNIPDDFRSLDTYANLLYKTGRSAEAIQAENNAIAKVKKGTSDYKELNDNLENMKKGEPTWKSK